MDSSKLQTGRAILEPDLIRVIEHFSLASGRRLAGRTAGERRSPRKGPGIEFADFRDYSPGDDLRRIDWNQYARSEKMFLKLFSLDEDRTVSILMDVSRSMTFGTPPKDIYARRLSAALAYLALIHMDRVSIIALRAGQIDRFGPIRGRSGFGLALEWLSRLNSDGDSGTTLALSSFLSSERLPGIAIIITDGLEDSFGGVIKGFRARDFDTTFIQILSPQDILPPVAGDLCLVDCETGDRREVTASAGLISRYRRALRELQADIERQCVNCGFSYFSLRTDQSLLDVFSKTFAGRLVE